jgi:uncharacterized repeat protein (TIGR01451 family)
MLKFHTGPFKVGGQGTFILRVTNVGTAAATNHIIVTDTLPFPLTLAVQPSGTNWDCTGSDLPGGTQINCQTDDDVLPGASLPDITVLVNIGQTILHTIVNEARVTMPGDVNPDNNTDDDVITLTGQPRSAPVMSPLGAAVALSALLGLGFFGLRRKRWKP